MTDNKSVRLGLFFDVGNVFDTSYNLDDLRYSAGLSAKWLSPFGGLAFSIAYPINSKTDCYGSLPINSGNGCSVGTPVKDQTQVFQFTFGQGF
jgi:outer membrane protein insertion porin family